MKRLEKMVNNMIAQSMFGCFDTEKENLDTSSIDGVRAILESTGQYSVARDICEALTDYVEIRDQLDDLKNRIGDELDVDSYTDEVTSMAEQSILESPRDYGLMCRDKFDELEEEKADIESEFNDYKEEVQSALETVATQFDVWLESLPIVNEEIVLSIENIGALRTMFHKLMGKYE